MINKVLRIAFLDLGTNTFNLLVAEIHRDAVHFIHREKIGVAFGAGVQTTGNISQDALERAFEALKHFIDRSKKFDCTSIHAYSTAALRNAANRENIIKTIQQKTGLLIEIVSGEQEAAWIAKAAMHGLPKSQNALIVDIGGGSVELIAIENQLVKQLASFPLGVTRLLELHPWSNPLNAKDIERLNAIFEDQCGHFLSTFHTMTLIGTAGVFETLIDLMQSDGSNHNTNVFNEPIEIEAQALSQILLMWLNSTENERSNWTSILPVRRKTLHLAAAYLRWLVKKKGVVQIIATPNSMAEGAALEFANKLD